MIKISLDGEELSELIQAANIFRADVVDLSNDYVVLQITGEPSKLDAFITYFEERHGICELSRTGPTAMGRGDYRLDTGKRKRPSKPKFEPAE